MNLKKELERLETKQEKVIFLRDLILDKKQKKKEKEEAIKLLNKLLQSETLEERLEIKTIEEDKTIQPSQKPMQIPAQSEEIKSEKYFTKGVSKSEESKISEKVVYSTNQRANLRNLKSFLDRKGLLSNPTVNKEQITQQITDYFGEGISPQRLENYFSLFSKDSVDYQAFKHETSAGEINISGKKREYYKFTQHEENR